MGRHAGLIALVCVFVLTAQASLYAHVSVLLYHKFDEADSPSTSVSSDMFDAQMRYLKEHHYCVMSMDELYGCISGEIPMPEKGVVITIDDGYLSEYTKAFPILKKYGYPFTIFVFTHAVGADNYMDWGQLMEVCRNRGQVGSHTHIHPHLVDIPYGKVEQELKVSKEIIEKHLGTKIKWFAYPFGDYDDQIRSIASSLGYDLMLTSDPGNVSSHCLPDMVPRQAIVGRNMTMKRFISKLDAPCLITSENSPGPGRLKGRGLSCVSLTIKDPQRYCPGQVQMFLSEKGRLKTTFDPSTGRLVCSEPMVLSKKVNRIITTARLKDGGKYAWDSYLIVLPEKNHEEDAKDQD